MPNSVSGFSGNEIVSRVQSFIGNYSQSFLTYLQQTIPLAEYRFCKMHDWNFLKKTGLSLNVTNGTAEYELSTATVGYYVAASDIESIYDEEAGIYLKKVDLNQIRRLDPKTADGSTTENATLWAEVGDNKVRFWPPSFKTGTLKIDGKITPTPLDNLSTFPTVPYRYQESLIEYITGMALDRENDDRATAKKLEARELIKADIADDKANSGGNDEPRIRSMMEKRNDGIGATNPFRFSDWDE
jgi:hypothetical protein